MRIEVEGGSLEILDLEDGRALIGDWQTDGSNPYAAILLYRKADKYCQDNNLQPVVTAETKEMTEFFVRMGLTPTSVVLTRL